MELSSSWLTKVYLEMVIRMCTCQGTYYGFSRCSQSHTLQVYYNVIWRVTYLYVAMVTAGGSSGLG